MNDDSKPNPITDIAQRSCRDIFEIQSQIACEIFDITKENFRKKLSRESTRKQGYIFFSEIMSKYTK